MKDLDFDELDRAVNSLVTSESGLNDNTELKEKTLSLESPASPLAGRRSTGQFMDVVRPSSNMRATLTTPERTSRQGTTITPISNTPITPNTNTTSVSADTSPAKTPPANSWPDPIDFHELNNKESDKNKDADINQISNDITDTLNQKVNEPQDSPFLSGAKVDKRPLGAFSAELTTPTVEPSTQETTPDKTTNTNDDAKLSDTDTPFPAELQDDLLLIESDNMTHSDKPSTTDASSTVTDDVSPPPTTTGMPPIANNVPPITNSVSVADNQPVGPTSIVQQYKEQPSSGDQNTGAIYDTNSYHKALVRPAKKKSGWLWVLWIVILLAIGAGAGVVVYFYVLPLL